MNKQQVGSHASLPLIERLEARRLLSAELMPGGELVLTGSDSADAIVVEQGPADGSVAVMGVPGVTDGTIFEGVTSITIDLLRGDDLGQINGTPLDALGNLLRASMRGGPGSDQLLGGEGDDSLNGGDGQDLILGNGGNDVLKGNTASDELLGGAGDDRLVGGEGLDTLFGEDGDDRLLGNTQSDELSGGNGNDRLVGGDAPDILMGDAGDDEIEGGAGEDELRGGDGNDILRAGGGRDTLLGEAGDDQLRGNGAGDDLHGGTGADNLKGGAGPDVLFGGLGLDEILGNAGEDNFRARLSERGDFQSNDLFYSEDASLGNPFAILPDDAWNVLEDAEAIGLYTTTLLPGIDGLQELFAECGPAEQAFFEALDELSDAELADIEDELEPIVTGFMDDIGDDLSGLTLSRVIELFIDLRAADLGPLEDEADEYADCWLTNEPAALDAFALLDDVRSQLDDLGLADLLSVFLSL